MLRQLRRPLGTALAALSFAGWQPACSPRGGASDAGPDVQTDARRDAGADAGADLEADGDTGAGTDAATDAGALRCSRYEDCASAPLDCDHPLCDLNTGTCRCNCTESSCAPGAHCVAGYCVGCANDEHCSEHTCGDQPGLDRPRCRPDTQECVCGGTCPDGVCDPVERILGTCPADCTSPCPEGQSLAAFCMNGEAVPWCSCSGGAWACGDPSTGCPGETACARAGGQCVATADECYEGTVQADALGCSGASPLCCTLADCVGPGESYYPYLGRCCPGLRAVPSRILIEGMIADGICCYDSCWALMCTPCGDGTCELHLGENFCTCPEDCPAPPAQLVCSQSATACGTAHCRQDGDVCHAATPRCDAGVCSWSSEDHPGQLCDPVNRTCRPR